MVEKTHLILIINFSCSYLTEEQLKSVTHAYVMSRLDYNNALLVGSPDTLINKLQIIQNAAARLITGTKKCTSITPILFSLHWLPVRQRIAFKVMLMTFKSLNNLGPEYLQELLILYHPTRTLRSSSSPLLLDVPRTRLKTFGDRSFSVFVPNVWNKLPENIRICQTTSSFKTALKTFLFSNYFNDKI